MGTGDAGLLARVFFKIFPALLALVNSDHNQNPYGVLATMNRMGQ